MKIFLRFVLVLLLVFNTSFAFAGVLDDEYVTPDGSGEDSSDSAAACDFQAFKEALGARESGGDYTAENQYGYIGKYQFGKAALNDIGYMRGNSWTGKNGINNKNDFKLNPEVQEAAMDEWIDHMAGEIRRYNLDNYIDEKIGNCDKPITWSGLLAGRHLKGIGNSRRPGLRHFLESNGAVDGKDGNGTPVSEYVCKFSGYNTPFDSGMTATECGGGMSYTGQSGHSPDTEAPANPDLITGGVDYDPDLDLDAHDDAKYDELKVGLKNVWVGSLQIMTSQLTTAMVNQIAGVGMLFDAKHQMEVQREFQRLTAQAHKDYHPSEQMCEVGTFVRNLSESEKYADLTQLAVSDRLLDRETVSGMALTLEGQSSDYKSRLKHFVEVNCNKEDAGRNAKDETGLSNLCKSSEVEPQRKNMDIDYTAKISAPLTIDTDFVKGGEPTADEEDMMALLNNLFYHEPFPAIAPTKTQLKNMSQPLQNMRSIIAMRGLARNSIANVIAEKTASPDGASAMPFIRALIKEFGLEETEIDKMFGENPSYHAQMEILTKLIYQHPEFIVNLYDKPANVKRVRAAMRAIKLMQDRDIHDAMMRREMLLSMILEVRLRDYQSQMVDNVRRQMGAGGGPPRR